jgi:glycosyltransferase involved in cell wall biosynthesis
MRQKVLLKWQASNYFGWGILGQNLFERWASDPAIQPVMAVKIEPVHFQCIDPLRMALMQVATAASNEFLGELTAGKADLRQHEVITIDALGNAFTPTVEGHFGARNVARCIFENTHMANQQRLDQYDELLCASEWNASLLRSISNKPLMMIHEGVDHSLFFAGPRSGLLDSDRFYVFSGGKVEFRKGQDLVIFAFREFAKQHPDAVLVAAWNSPWPEFSDGYQANLQAPLRRDDKGVLEIRRWVTENGIPPQQFINLPMIPNPLMPMVLRQMDCSVQVSRCEPCTNLPAMEAMACGVPVILANNTGMRDLIDTENCIALRTQHRVNAVDQSLGTEGWGESDVEEIVAALEQLYTDTQLRKRIAARGAQWILERGRTWRDHAGALKSYLLGTRSQTRNTV